MNAPVKITATVGAYLTEYREHADLLHYMEDPERHSGLVGNFVAYSAHDMSRCWQRIGEAQITLSLSSKDEMVQSAIKALNGQIEEARAKFMEKQAELLERISKLQALEFTPAAEAVEESVL